MSVGISTVLNEEIPFLGFLSFYFKGSFHVHLKWNQFFKPFNSNTFDALKIGISQFFASLSLYVPGMLMRKLLGYASANEKEFNNILAGYNVYNRIGQITECIIIGIGMGYLPAASYANAAGNHKRFIKLTFHLLWICASWSIITTTMTCAIPRQLSQIFGGDDDFLDWSSDIIFYVNISEFIYFTIFSNQVILQALGYASRALTISIVCEFLSIIVAELILFFINKHNPILYLFAYLISNVFDLILGTILVGGPLYRTFKQTKELESIENTNAETESLKEEELSDFSEN
jgi:Na+-driven multidrug efflux pump